MKLPETELNIGDSLWNISCNVPTEWKVKEIKCFVTNNSVLINYETYKATNPACLYTTSEGCIGVTIFKSKQELMMHCFGDCITKGLIVK